MIPAFRFTRSDLALSRRSQFGAPQLRGSVCSCSLPKEEFIQKEQEQQLERRWRIEGEDGESRGGGK